jgi:hypothetical protein
VVKVALIADKAFDLHNSPLMSLLEVKLAQEPNLVLLERHEIDKILQEQQFSAAGLVRREAVIEVGQLLRADALVLLSAEDGEEAGQNKLLRVRLVETAHGLRLLDKYEQWDTPKLEEAAARITEKIASMVSKLTLTTGQAIPVGIVDIHRVQLGERYKWLERTLATMLSVRLSREPQIIMLEREDLKILHDEKLLTGGEDTEFWNSAVLIDGYLQPRGRKTFEMVLRLRQAGDEMAAFTVSVEPNQPATAVQEAAANIIQAILNAPPATSWDLEQEAEEFFRQGKLLMNLRRVKDAMAPLETAHVLQPENVFYTGAVFTNEWGARRVARPLKPFSWYSDPELADIASHLVQQIRTAYETRLLSARDILDQWGNLLGGGPSRGYFGSPVSVATDQVRRVNAESRRIWVDTMQKALKREDDEDARSLYPIRRASLAWVSSDVPEQLIRNVRQTYTKLLMPPEMGGEVRPVSYRSMLCSQLLAKHSGIESLQPLEWSLLRGSGECIQKLWRQYLKELFEVGDPLVRFYACLALAGYEKEDKPSAKKYRYRALEILQEELRTLHDPSGDYTKRRIRTDMKNCLTHAGIDKNELVRIWEEIYEPLIREGNVDNLVLWDPGWRPGMFYHPQVAEASQRYFQLLEKIAEVLQIRRHDKNVRKALNKIRDYQARIREKFPHLHLPQKLADLPVTMLLAKEDWPKKKSTKALRVQLQESMLWVGFIEPPYKRRPAVGLAGIDLEKKKSSLLCQTDLLCSRLTGMVIGKDASYLSLCGVGLTVFPGSVTTGKYFLENPKVLTQEHGLPPVHITGMTGNTGKLWIAYGGAQAESGLGIYEPRTGHWETIFCSTLEGESPLSRGEPYVPYELTLGPTGKLFFQIWVPLMSTQWMGLWKIDTKTLELKYFGLGGLSEPAGGRLINFAEEWWFKTPYYLIQFDPISEQARLMLGDPYWLKAGGRRKLQTLNLERDPFIAESSHKGLAYGPCGIHGNLDLSTAAVHGDRLWARLGESQLMVIHQGRSIEEAEIFDNNILNGGKVLEFLSTPYGLIAIGDGTVGLIETQNDDK